MRFTTTSYPYIRNFLIVSIDIFNIPNASRQRDIACYCYLLYKMVLNKRFGYGSCNLLLGILSVRPVGIVCFAIVLLVNNTVDESAVQYLPR